MAKCDSDRAKFFHPYDPYDIQLDFMKALYETIDGKKIGLFESPTGMSDCPQLYQRYKN